MPSSSERNDLKHLFLNQSPQKDRYTSPKQGYSKEFISNITEKDIHGENLKRQIQEIENIIPAIKETRAADGVREDFGIFIEFESPENVELKYESLADERAGIEITNIREDSQKTFVTVYVPDGKLKNFYNKISQYLDHNKLSKKNKPRNQQLIETIEKIHLATLKAFWTGIENFDEITPTEERWWELWLRTGQNKQERKEIEDSFLDACNRNSVILKNVKLDFPERIVYLAKTSKDILSRSFTLLNCFAELRNPQETAATFMEMPLNEQRDWVELLLSRIELQDGNLPAVCILDTGVNNGHPLISIALENSDNLTYNPAWGVDDQDGHGTGMAGLALYGDLFEQLISSDKIELIHRLESVKILHPSHIHEPELYGAVTNECIARSEENSPQRNKVFCMAISSEESGYGGRPTSWSAALDKTCFGDIELPNTKRIILLAAGNIMDTQLFLHYPNINENESIQDPGQSWNSITVGGYTTKKYLEPTRASGYEIIASPMNLAPSSTTSVSWLDKWPLKPEIVLEAGNYAKEISTNFVSSFDSLSLLTTNHKTADKLFDVFRDTSAATAQASRIVAQIQYYYPNYWPETLRGLLIHSAEWTNEMLNSQNIDKYSTEDKIRLLRKYGYGVPNLNRALWCANNFSTLILEQYLTPFFADEKGIIKTNEVNFHNLPWPKEYFQENGNINIKLKITLSYFIEPNPTHRKHLGKYDYSSFGLRFNIRKGIETLDDFRKRINKEARDDSEETRYSGLRWLLGPKTRDIGSIHSDSWTGSAAELAEMDTIAVYPVSGWWRTRKKLDRWDNTIRYSLIISLETEAQEIDLYTPIKNMIEIPITITSA